MGLNESYSQTRGQILLIDPLPAINKVFSLVAQEEKQREITARITHNLDSVAMVAKNFNRNQYTNEGINNYTGPNNKKECRQCSHHGLLGHKIDKCYKVHGYPPRYKFKNKNPVVHGVTNQNASISGSQKHALANLADTGATDHMVCSVHSLTEITASASRFVKLPNGTLTEVRASIFAAPTMLQSTILDLNVNTIHQCDVCPTAKLHRLPYVSSEINSSTPFDLIHADLWGPLSTTAIDGSKYFLTLVDDFTRCTSVQQALVPWPTEAYSTIYLPHDTPGVGRWGP
ncbi:uncharacterized protein LOC111397952 [Olea europaea var. sylvestris]|uniref:uncharacterized protein LOC111397952 n=1 Tax=Olea europaea var. sylvestris TaxID=158386 RepID=UPI000C1D7478|nr:uncharacterized protein LOC111397952 [Olea europaea var. sylvestris]